MTFHRYGNHPQPVPRGPEPVEIGNGHRIVKASAEDIAAWRADPSTPMYSPQVAAAAAIAIPAAPSATDEFKHFMFLLGGPFRKFGSAPSSGAFDIPAVPGSASDPNTSHMGCAAQIGPWQ